MSVVYKNEFTKWIPIFPNGRKAILTDSYVGFTKKNAKGYHMGGCYLYAYDPSGNIQKEAPNHLDERVQYIGAAGSSTYRGVRNRTTDFSGAIVKGMEHKKPYPNGLMFRFLYGEEQKQHLYVSYFPIGYGNHIKRLAHSYEQVFQNERKEKYGELPPLHGDLSKELEFFHKMQKMNLQELERINKYSAAIIEAKNNNVSLDDFQIDF